MVRRDPVVSVELVDCPLRRVDFASADLRGATFRRCGLTQSEFHRVRAAGTVFVDCTWDGVRGVTDLAGATVAITSPVDALVFASALASGLGVRLTDASDFPEVG